MSVPFADWGLPPAVAKYYSKLSEDVAKKVARFESYLSSDIVIQSAITLTEEEFCSLTSVAIDTVFGQLSGNGRGIVREAVSELNIEAKAAILTYFLCEFQSETKFWGVLFKFQLLLSVVLLCPETKALFLRAAVGSEDVLLSLGVSNSREIESNLLEYQKVCVSASAFDELKTTLLSNCTSSLIVSNEFQIDGRLLLNQYERLADSCVNFESHETVVERKRMNVCLESFELLYSSEFSEACAKSFEQHDSLLAVFHSLQSLISSKFNVNINSKANLDVDRLVGQLLAPILRRAVISIQRSQADLASFVSNFWNSINLLSTRSIRTVSSVMIIMLTTLDGSSDIAGFKVFDILRHSQSFWTFVSDCLNNGELTVRKRGVFVLQFLPASAKPKSNSFATNEKKKNKKNKNNNANKGASAAPVENAEVESTENQWWSQYLEIYHQIESCNQGHLIDQVWNKVHALAVDVTNHVDDRGNVSESGCPILSFAWLVSLLNCLLHNQIPTIRKSILFKIFSGKLPLNYKDKNVLSWISDDLLVVLNNPIYFPAKCGNGFDNHALNIVMNYFLENNEKAACPAESTCSTIHLAKLLSNENFSTETVNKTKSQLIQSPGCLLPAFLSHILSELVLNSHHVGSNSIVLRNFFLSEFFRTTFSKINSMFAVQWILHVFTYNSAVKLIENGLGGTCGVDNNELYTNSYFLNLIRKYYESNVLIAACNIKDQLVAGVLGVLVSGLAISAENVENEHAFDVPAYVQLVMNLGLQRMFTSTASFLLETLSSKFKSIFMSTSIWNDVQRWVNYGSFESTMSLSFIFCICSLDESNSSSSLCAEYLEKIKYIYSRPYSCSETEKRNAIGFMFGMSKFLNVFLRENSVSSNNMQLHFKNLLPNDFAADYASFAESSLSSIMFSRDGVQNTIDDYSILDASVTSLVGLLNVSALCNFANSGSILRIIFNVLKKSVDFLRLQVGASLKLNPYDLTARVSILKVFSAVLVQLKQSSSFYRSIRQSDLESDSKTTFADEFSALFYEMSSILVNQTSEVSINCSIYEINEARFLKDALFLEILDLDIGELQFPSSFHNSEDIFDILTKIFHRIETRVTSFTVNEIFKSLSSSLTLTVRISDICQSSIPSSESNIFPINSHKSFIQCIQTLTDTLSVCNESSYFDLFSACGYMLVSYERCLHDALKGKSSNESCDWNVPNEVRIAFSKFVSMGWKSILDSSSDHSIDIEIIIVFTEFVFGSASLIILSVDDVTVSETD